MKRRSKFKRKSKLISCLLAMFLVFEIILPVNSSGKVFADSLGRSSVEESPSSEQNMITKPDKEVIEGDLGDSTIEKPEEITGEASEEEVKPEETPGENPELDAKPGEEEAIEENPEGDEEVAEEESSVDQEDIKEEQPSKVVEEEEKPAVLDGGIYDNPISTWSFSGVEDLNRDGIINEKDLSLASAKYNATKGQASYDSAMDFNKDGIIDVYDLTRISSRTGTKGKIVIDPGHGGSDPGAIGPTGLKEKDVVLNVGLKVRDLLEAYGYTVVMTRTTDVYVSLQERCDIANNSDADLFVSIHNNSFKDPSANGTETYSFFPNDLGGQLAKSIQNKLVSAFGLRNRGHKTADYYVLRNTEMPAALAELAFISNPTEEALLRTDAFQTKAAKALVDGILGLQ